MKQDEEPTIVVFRKWKKSVHAYGDGILALFPEDRWSVNMSISCSSYEHVGQHGAANYVGCISRTVPATPGEYKPLKQELEQLGYRLVVRKRWSAR